MIVNYFIIIPNGWQVFVKDKNTMHTNFLKKIKNKIKDAFKFMNDSYNGFRDSLFWYII